MTKRGRMEAWHGAEDSHLLQEVMRTHQIVVGTFSRKIGMPVSRFLLMRLVAIAENGCGVMDMSRALGINAAAVTRQVQEMESDGLVVRKSDMKDGRRSRVTLSPKGVDMFRGLHRQAHGIERRLEAMVPGDGIAIAVATLSKLRAILESIEED